MKSVQPLVLVLAAALLATLSLARPYMVPDPLGNGGRRDCGGNLLSWASIACDLDPHTAERKLGKTACEAETWKAWSILATQKCVAKCVVYFRTSCRSPNRGKGLDCDLEPEDACSQVPYAADLEVETLTR